MFKLKLVSCLFVVSCIYGDRLEANISDIDSLNAEENEIEEISYKNASDKAYYDNSEIDSIERDELEPNDVTTNKNVNKTVEDVVKDVNDTYANSNIKIKPFPKLKIDNEEVKKLKIVNKEVKEKVDSNNGVDRNDTSSEDDTTEKSVVKVHNELAKRKLFKNCRDMDNEELCRRTLIDYPYAVSIQKLGAHYSTGALMNKRWILTAAGDFYNIRESIKLFRARLGSVNCKRGGVTLPLQEVSIHPHYVPGKPGYDLALLRLGEAVNYTDYIKPIRVSVAKERVLSAKFLTTYWPRLIVNGEILPHDALERMKPTNLRVSTQRLIGGQYCKKMMLEMNERLQEGSLCLKPLVTHHSLCMPDPGAPVVADDGLWGITSGWTSKLCYLLPGPTIFTRITSPFVRSWLNAKLLDM